MADGTITLMLCGDVMVGRGIDQVLPHPSEPTLYEPWVKSAIDYVEMAERANGPIGRSLPFGYIWGDALPVLAAWRPDARIVNLETAICRADRPWPKAINYRMNPDNVRCLTALGVDCCVLANNHVLDWGREGLLETLDSLRTAGFKFVGAGRNNQEATAPVSLSALRTGRILVYAFACASSGVPADWDAGVNAAGVNFLSEATRATAHPIAAGIRSAKQKGDIIVCSVHWGPNWGYEISRDHRDFAHELIETGGVDIVFGHSSHHPKGIEVYRGRPILYGCGDFINDYEGIEIHEPYRDDLTLMHLIELDAKTGGCVRIDLVPFRIRRFRLNRPDAGEVGWLRGVMDRECGHFGGKVVIAEGDQLRLLW
jgi:poly-gamma-glutamate synthesis protein (capsule biosynthesis protein)